MLEKEQEKLDKKIDEVEEIEKLQRDIKEINERFTANVQKIDDEFRERHKNISSEINSLSSFLKGLAFLAAFFAAGMLLLFCVHSTLK